MNYELIMERQNILQLALEGAFRERDICQSNFDNLNNKLTELTLDGCSFSEKDKVVESMLYLKECINGWQDTINGIRNWQDELKKY